MARIQPAEKISQQVGVRKQQERKLGKVEQQIGVKPTVAAVKRQRAADAERAKQERIKKEVEQFNKELDYENYEKKYSALSADAKKLVKSPTLLKQTPGYKKYAEQKAESDAYNRAMYQLNRKLSGKRITWYGERGSRAHQIYIKILDENPGLQKQIYEATSARFAAEKSGFGSTKEYFAAKKIQGLKITPEDLGYVKKPETSLIDVKLQEKGITSQAEGKLDKPESIKKSKTSLANGFGSVSGALNSKDILVGGEQPSRTPSGNWFSRYFGTIKKDIQANEIYTPGLGYVQATELGGTQFGQGTAVVRQPTAEEQRKIDEAQEKGDFVGEAITGIPSGYFTPSSKKMSDETYKKSSSVFGYLNPLTQYQIFKEDYEYRQALKEAQAETRSFEKYEEKYKQGKITEGQFQAVAQDYSQKDFWKPLQYRDVMQRIAESDVSSTKKAVSAGSIRLVETASLINPVARSVVGADILSKGGRKVLEAETGKEMGIGFAQFTLGGVLAYSGAGSLFPKATPAFGPTITGSPGWLKAVKVSSYAAGTSGSLAIGALDTYSQYKKTGDLATSIGAGAGTAGGVFTLFYGPKAYQKASDYWRTRGRKEILAEDLFIQDILSGKKKFVESSSYGYRGPQSGPQKQAFDIKIFKQKDYAYHVTPSQYWKKDFTTTPGSSEFPGLYVAPSPSIYFAKLGGKGSSYSLQLGGGSQVATSKPSIAKVFTGFTTKQGTSQAFVTGIKPEIESVIRPGETFTLTGSEYFVRYLGRRIPIDEFARVVGSGSFANVAGTGVGSVSGSSSVVSGSYIPSGFSVLPYSVTVSGSSSSSSFSKPTVPSSSYSPTSSKTSPYSPTSSFSNIVSGSSLPPTPSSPLKIPSYSPPSSSKVSPPSSIIGPPSYSSQPPRPPKKPTYPGSPVISFSKDKQRRKSMEQGYYAEVRSGKKWIRVHKQPLRRNAALGKGAEVVDNTTSRRFRLKPTKKKPTQQSNPYFGLNRQKFRSYSIVRGVPEIGGALSYIERKQYGIDTRGEKRGLSVARYLKQKRQRVNPFVRTLTTKKKKRRAKSQWLF